MEFLASHHVLFFSASEVKGNLKDAARTRDKISGHTLLRNAELLGPLIDWIHWSAFLPSSEEFDAFWTSVILRMSSKATTTDWGEKKFANYMKSNLFDVSGPLLRAPWGSGFGICPPGYTTYTPNTIESSHRTLKLPLDPEYSKRDVGALMVEVCHTVASRVEQGKFSNMHKSLQ